MLSVSNITAYVRAECNELDSKRVDDVQILRYINYGQNKVQNDFTQIQFKLFTKTAYNTGSVFTQPSDLLAYPNSIINLLAGTGTVRASKTISYTGPTANLKHTYKEPGTPGNAVTINCDGGTYASPGSGQISALFVGGAWYFEFGGSLTGAQIVTAFNSDPLYSRYFICSTDYPSATPVPSVGTGGALTGGVGGGYKPADEASSEDFPRITDNPYKAAASSKPKYHLIGQGTSKLIECAPTTITYSLLEYYYRLADLSLTTDTLGVPNEIEELVLIDVQRRIYEKVKNGDMASAMMKEYAEKFEQYVKNFIGTRNSQQSDKERIQSADTNK